VKEGLDDLRRMAVFAAVVEAQSFSEAARRLGLAKSAVSKQISELEQNLGVRLMNRTTRRLNLTEAGERFYQSCARILREAVDATQAVRDLQSQPKGILRVNASVYFGSRYVVPQLARFIQTYPDIHLEIQLVDHYVDLIDDQADLAIRIGRLEDSSLVVRKLASVSTYLCAAPSLLQTHGRPDTPRELERLPAILYTHANSPTRLVIDGADGAESLRLSGSVRTNNGSAILELLRAGVGIGVLPEFFVREDVEAGRLVRLFEDRRVGGDTAVYAVYPHSRHVQTKVRLFVDFLVEAFQSPPWSC
jgi:DNA-binding transcriptional LysR family regulator